MHVLARRAAFGSVAVCAVGLVAALAAAALVESGNQLAAAGISVACSLVGFISGSVAAALGSSGRDVWLGLTGTIGSLLVAAMWIVVSLSILSTT